MHSSLLSRIWRAGSHPLLLISLGTLLTSMGRQVYQPTLAPYALSLGASLALLGLISGSYAATQVFLKLPVGALADRLDRRKVFVLVGSLCSVLGSLGFVLISDPAFFVLARGLTGIGGASLTLVMVVFAMYSRGRDLIHSMGLFNSVSSLAVALAPLLGGLVATYWGLTAPFVVGTVLGAIGLIAFLGIREPRTEPAPAEFEETSLYRLARHPQMIQAGLLAFISAAAQFATAFTFVPVVALELGAGQWELGLFLFLTYMAAAIATLASGMLTARVGRRPIAAASIAVVGLAVLALPAVETLFALGALQVLLGLGVGVGYPVFSVMALSAGTPRDQGRTAAIYQTGGALGAFIGPVVGGVMAEWLGLDPMFLLFGGVALLAAAIPFVGQWWQWVQLAFINARKF